MGFNKRNIDKDKLMKNLDFSKINMLARSDALILDKWCTKFYDNYDFKYQDYQEKREKILQKTMFDSFHSFDEFDTYGDLKSLSNIFVNLTTNPNWLDIWLTMEIIKIDVPKESHGKFDDLLKLCLGSIQKKFS